MNEEEEFRQAIGRRIRQWRGWRCMKCNVLANRIGVHSTMITLIETGQRNCSLWQLSRIACTLNVPIEAFFTDQEFPKKETNE